MAVGQLGTTNIPTRHRILRGEELLVEGSLRHVTVGIGTPGKIGPGKTPIPEWMRAGLAPYVVEAEPAGVPGAARAPASG